MILRIPPGWTGTVHLELPFSEDTKHLPLAFRATGGPVEVYGRNSGDDPWSRLVEAGEAETGDSVLEQHKQIILKASATANPIFVGMEIAGASGPR